MGFCSDLRGKIKKSTPLDIRVDWVDYRGF